MVARSTVDMGRAAIVAGLLAACSQGTPGGGSAAPPPNPPIGPPAVRADAPRVTPDAAVAARVEPPPAMCIPHDEPEWTCPELGVAADGERVIVCLRETCGGGGEIGCMLVDPRSGEPVGPARWPAARTPDFAPAPAFQLFTEDRTLAVCRDGDCRRIHDMLPVGTRDATNVAVNATGTQVLLYNGDETATTYSVTTQKRLAHVSFVYDDGPPPPLSSHDIAYHGRGVLLGDFTDLGIIELGLDPITGHHILLDKPWARLPGDLLAHFDGLGEAQLIDFDANLRVVARRKTGRPHQPTEGVSAAIAYVAGNAVIVTQDPPATLFVDAKARTISRPRPLPLCR